METEINCLSEIRSWTAPRKMYMFEHFFDLSGKIREPIALEDKSVFWMQFIRELCSSKRTAVFQVDDATNLVKAKIGAAPRCLQSIVNVYIRDRIVFSFDEMKNFLDGNNNGERKGWTFGGLFKAMTFSTNSLFPKEPSYVLLDVLQNLAEELFQHIIRKKTGADIVMVSNLRQMTASIVGNEPTFDLILLLLQKEHRCCISTARSGKKFFIVIRNKHLFVKPEEDDLEIVELETKAGQISAEIKDIMKQIEKLQKDELKFCEKKQVEQVIHAQRLRKHLEFQLGMKKMEMNEHLHNIDILRTKKVCRQEELDGQAMRRKL